MMLTQKVTDLAIIQHDGECMTSGAPDSRKEQVQVPLHQWSLLLSQLEYLFSAPGLLAGPLYRFMEYGGLPQKSAPKTLVLYKIVIAAAFFSVHSATGTVFPLHKNGDPDFVESTPFLHRVFYLWISSFLARLNYYWLWSLSEGLCNAAGLGYSIRDARGRWDALSDYSFFTLEVHSNE
ncbi:MBOAT2 [Branchiostoma lanceolatum]|uniref:MBOAT2 protein n=1 Tax=Branchiostoma lanceolatum TaxID=7740 RepID=A0A8K0EDZ1_BRALA|nr:MBOAT2 [Branchiostoma lanceolatum]